MYFIEVNDRKKKKYSSLGGHNWLEKQLHWQYIIQYADYILKKKKSQQVQCCFLR